MDKRVVLYTLKIQKGRKRKVCLNRGGEQEERHKKKHKSKITLNLTRPMPCVKKTAPERDSKSNELCY